MTELFWMHPALTITSSHISRHIVCEKYLIERMTIGMIQENIEHVEKVIDDICTACNRNRKEVTLIAVSKTKPVEMLKEAYETGCRDFGENKVQELVEKYEQLPKDIRWHMIGHLQRNKVKYIVDKVYLIHSVDSFRLAEEISKEAAKKNVSVNILVEVNVAGEDTKFGTDCEEAKQLVRDIAQLPNVHVKGLMTIPPADENITKTIHYFENMYKKLVDIRSKKLDNISMNCLSMGMSADYAQAIEAGANIVRVGSALFGQRVYK